MGHPRFHANRQRSVECIDTSTPRNGFAPGSMSDMLRSTRPVPCCLTANRARHIRSTPRANRIVPDRGASRSLRFRSASQPARPSMGFRQRTSVSHLWPGRGPKRRDTPSDRSGGTWREVRNLVFQDGAAFGCLGSGAVVDLVAWGLNLFGKWILLWGQGSFSGGGSTKPFSCPWRRSIPLT